MDTHFAILREKSALAKKILSFSGEKKNYGYV